MPPKQSPETQGIKPTALISTHPCRPPRPWVGKLAKLQPAFNVPDTAGHAHKTLFLVGYDISDNARRRRALRQVQQHALGGQKSFYECWLSVAELHDLLAQLQQHIDPTTDRVVLIRLDARTQSLQLGQAEPIASADFFHIA